MYVKIFQQIYDSSIVENPETRFTFMDFLILADQNGVVDMTHEAIARRTNRPIKIICETIAELEGCDPRSRTSDMNGARIYRLDDHRDWGWGITNYEQFRDLATQDQRREKTKLRTRKWREKNKTPVTLGDDLPSASACTSASFGKSENLFNSDLSGLSVLVRAKFEDWIIVRKAMSKSKAPANWTTMFNEQIKWLLGFSEGDQIEILSASIRANWQGLFEPKRGNNGAHTKNTTRSSRNTGTSNEGKSGQYAGVGKVK